MTILKNETIIEVPANMVWSVLLNLEEVARYNDMVTYAQYISSVKNGVGAERKCTLKSGFVKERVTDIKKDQSISMEITESSWPLKYMRWTTEIIAMESEKTLVRQTSIYEPGMGFMGKLMDQLFMKRQMKITLDSVFEGMKNYLENKKYVLKPSI